MAIKSFVIMMINTPNQYEIYRGEKAVYKFMEAMLDEVQYCKTIMKNNFNKPLIMTEKDEEEFQKATKCHICDKQYTEK